MSRTASAPTLDLTDPCTFVQNDPIAYWRARREHHPVQWHESPHDGRGFWSVSRYDDVVAGYRDAAALSSARGTVLDVLLHGDDAAGGKMLAVTDRPRHRDLRAIVLKVLSPKVLDRVAEDVRRRASARVRAMAEQGALDFASEFAERIPLDTVCDLLSIPEADRADLLAWNKRALSSDDDGAGGAQDETALEARNEIVFYLLDLVESRRARPGSDVVSLLAEARVQDEPLSTEEIALNCYSLVLGGDESSRMSAITGMKLLAENPAAWRSVRSGAADLDTTVEEILRWATPAMYFARTATTDLDIAGSRIRAGDIVTLWNISANQDERVFGDPERFDIARRPNKHVTFGYGPHFCVGAYLARVELHSLLEAVRRWVREVHLTGAPCPVYSNFLRGFSSLPMAFVAA